MSTKRLVSRIVLLVVFAVVTSLVTPVQMEQASAQEVPGPVLGAQLYSTGEPVEIEVLSATAGLTSTLFLLDPEEVRIATNRDVGTLATVGPYESGLELVFGIRVSGREYRMGPAERNPDGVVHAAVEFLDDGCAIVGFEDLFGGGDRDYDDNRFRFCGGVASEPPDPEPEPEPEPFAPPVADAGPDQSVAEGSVVTLDATGSTASTSPVLDPSEATENLPGGTALGVGLSGLEVVGGALLAVGSTDVGEGPAVSNTSIAYVIDVSGSAGFEGGCGGDQNGDGLSDQIIDCEIAAALELHASVLAAGTVDKVGLVRFHWYGTVVDVDPTSGFASLTAPDADLDGDGVLDIEQALRSLRAGGGTNFVSAASTTCSLLSQAGSPNLVAAFISDGASSSGNLASVVPCDPPVTFEAFAIGAANSCTAGRENVRLQDLADLSGGSCTHVPDVGDLPGILPDVIGSRIVGVEYTIDGGDPVDFSDEIGVPIDGPSAVDLSIPLPGDLAGGTHELCVTVYGTDVGGDGSVTTCSEVKSLSGDVTYRWDLIDADGPPVFLSSATSATPSFVAPDDATYLFELTVTDGAGLTDTDRVSVTVSNLDPSVTVEPGAAFAGGVTLVNASFTDPGWMDTHSATVDWGDGAVDDVVVTAQGSGWGTFFGSHVFESSGSYAVTVTLLDDDGGTAVVSVAELTVADPVAVWANSETASKTLDWSGASGMIEGRVHSNNELRFVGQTKTVIGPVTYAGELSADTDRHIFEPAPALGAVQDYPIRFDVADFRPGGLVSVAVGDAYHDMSTACASGKWHETQVVLDPGVYYADCDIQINGSNVGGRITLVSEGSIIVSGSRPAFEPFFDGLLFLAGDAGSKAIDLAASDSKFLGVLFAGYGEIDISGAENRFFCGILGDRVDLSGGNLTIRGANCGRPDSTVSGPLLVPGLSLDVTADLSDVSPTETITYDVAITIDGALLVVPGLMGLENVDAVSATVTGFEFSIEYFSIADNTWMVLGSVADGGVALDTSANAAAGVSYPADGGPVGTVIEPDGLATWGFQGLVDLSPAQVTMLLDPAVTGGIRNRTEFDLDPSSTQVRRLFTYGSDFIDELRALSGDVTAVDGTLLLPEGDPITLDEASAPGLGSLAPGESVTVSEPFTVAAPTPRGVGETDAGYLTRLLAADGAVLVGAGFAFGTGGVGRLVAPLSTVSSIEHVPVVSISTVGPDEIPAGTSAVYDLPMANLGSLDATGVAVTASADADVLTVTGAATGLIAGELVTATTSYTAPADTDGGPIAVRSEVSWADANGVSYGPVGSTVDAVVLAPATMAATLTDTLVVDVAGDGMVSPGDTVRYTLTVTNTGGVALSGVTASVTPDANSVLVDGSVVTTDGVVTGTDPAVVFNFGDVSAAASGVFDVVVADPFPVGVTRLSVQGLVSAAGFDDVATDDPALPGAVDATRTAVVVPVPNLVAFLTGGLVVDRDGNGYPSAGDLLRFTVSVNSVGSLPVSGVELSVPTPAGAVLVNGSVTTTAGSVTSGTDVSVQVGSLASFESAEIIFDFDVADPVPAGVTEIAVQGTVTSNELGSISTDDPDSSTIGDAFVITLGPDGGGGGDPEAPGPTVAAISPADGEIVTAPTTVTASLTPPQGEDVAGWSVGYRAADSIPVTELASGTSVDATADLDPTVLPNGMYFLVVTAEATGGGVSVTESSFVVDGRLKPGRFVTTFQDMAVGVAGFPIEVNRTYDSFDKTTGDFGVGWSLDVADFAVSSNGPLGAGGWLMEQCGGGLIFVPLCFRTERPHFVTVTWPDGLTEVFDLTPAEGSTFMTGLTSAEFTGRANTTSTLEAVDASLYWSNGDLLAGFFGSDGAFDPSRYRLTDRFGTEYLLDVDQGLLEMRDRNDNTLTITNDGVTSSFGPGIDFNRDTMGRVTSIVGPDGATVSYGYDTDGDLVSVTDQNGHTTTYAYQQGHFLDEILDPLGHPMRTLEYDANGRLAAIVDGEGNRVEIVSDVDARQEVVTDAEGRLTTISTFDERGNTIQIDEIFDGASHVTVFGYDASDNLVSRTDPDGNTWSATYDGRDLVFFSDPVSDDITIAYDEFGFPLLWTDQEGGVTEYVWNADGTLDRIVDPFLNAESYTYYPDGRRETRTDRENNTWTWTYYSDGRVETEEDAEGNLTRFFYDGSGRLVRTVDALGGETLRSYDNVGNLRFLTDPELNVSEWRYDALNRLERRIDPASDETVWTYLDNGLVHTVKNGVGETTTYTYDRNGRTTTMQVAALTPTSYTYDAAGRLESVTDPEGRSTSYSYYSNGQLRSETSPFGGTTNYFYFDDGQLRRAEDPFGATTSYTYTASGRIDTVTDPMSRVTDYDYDLAGRQTVVTFDDGTTTESVYDRAGRLVSSFDQDRAETVYGYDGVGNRTTVTDPRNRTITYGFDSLGRLETITDALSETTTYRYDGAGRLVETESPTGVVMVYDYYADGLRKSKTDEYGNTWSWTYDGAGRLDVETDARGAATDHDYDPAGRLASITDHSGNTVSFGHNDASERVRLTDPLNKSWLFDPGPTVRTETDPLGNTQTWVHDVGGRLESYTDGRGVTQTYNYYADGQIDTISHPDGSVSYTYDPVGRRETMTDESGTTTWNYDSVGRMAAVAAPAGEVSYTYYADGSRESMTQPEGTVTYAYDSAGRLATITDWDSGQVWLSYDADGRLEALTRPNGITTSYSYDSAGRLGRIDHADGAGLVEFFDYTLDANGNRQAVVSSAGAESYTLNLLNQLTGVTYPDGASESFTYDAAGNRHTASTAGVTTTYSYNDASQLLSDGTDTYSYDGAGNLTGDGTALYGWDWDGRLASVTAGTDTTSYVYDGDGVRVASTDGVGTTGYVYDRQGGLATLVSGGGEAFLHGPDGVLGSYGTTGTSWVFGDALDSVRGVTDSSGAVTGTSSFAVFGNTRTSAGIGTPFGFTGAQHDPTGLVYLNARYLSPGIGSFLSVDPVRPGAPGVTGWNPYSYVGNNPTTWADPGGMTSSGDYAGTLTVGSAASVAVRPLGQIVVDLLTLAVARWFDCLSDGPLCDTFAGPWGPSPGGGQAAPDWMRELARQMGVDWSDVDYCWANYLTNPAACDGLPDELRPGVPDGVRPIETPYGPAVQATDAESLAARARVEAGARLWRIGTMGTSAGPEGQFWSLEHPLTPGYAERHGLPPGNVVDADFIESAVVPPGTDFVTRLAPGIGTNAGGAIEVVVDPSSVRMCGYNTIGGGC